ncbi:MAG: 3-phosphoshikimate 1-carboxyvinyltransferase, partial [Bacteroidales bacterium]|nr:3-phosphoshikimate 1-carboxyvinyltransferase [Candidatus Colimorpha merdihippi]
TLQSFDDHRIAMSFLMAGLNAAGTTTLQGCRNIATSYPSFEHTLRELTSR